MSTNFTKAKERGQGLARQSQNNVAEARERFRPLDQLIRTIQHYGGVLGNQLAGAVTYFGFLSFFPIVALAFSGVGYIIDYVPDADRVVTEAIESLLPGMVGTEPGQINVEAIADRRAGVGIIGLLGLLYAGLGWMSAIRGSLRGVFSVVAEKKRNFVVGKAIDLVVLGIIGAILITSVAAGTAMAAFSREVSGWLGIADLVGVTVLLRLVVVAVGIAANTLMFFAIYRLLSTHRVAARVVWQGALIAGTGFEVLKELASLVIGNVTGNALYGAFAIMVALLVWINYFARLTVLGACWVAVGGLIDSEETDNEQPDSEQQAPADASTTPQGRGGRLLITAASGIGVALLVLRRGRARTLGMTRR